MNNMTLFLDYLWDLKPNYFDMKALESDVAFNRKALKIEMIDDIFIGHLNKKHIFIDKPIDKNNLIIGLTEKGGAYWERIYSVNWNNYIYFEVNKVGLQQEVQIYSKNRDLLSIILSKLENPLIIGCLDGWNVTYWKKLDHVFFTKLYFSQDDDQDLWDIFHRADLPTWREYDFD